MNGPEHDQPPAESEAAHYFSATPLVGSKRHRIRLDLPDRSLELVTDRGVFSPDRVDSGTKLLLLELPELAPGPVLDLGCGYGPIAVTLLARRPDQPLWAVDVNERARALCALNLTRNASADAQFHVMAPEQVPDDVRFRTIVSNPPIRVGKQVLHELLGHWLDRLTDDGEAWLVVHRHLGADSLARWLDERGHGVERVRSRQGYRVLRVSARRRGSS